MGWMDSFLVLELHVLPLISRGKSRGNWLLDIVHEFSIDAGGRWLSLGCGGADQEIFSAEQGLFSAMDAYDLSTEAVELAVKKAQAKGVTCIDFHVADLNSISLRDRTYDVAVMSMSLHHVARIDRLLMEVRRALKPAGWFLVNEYIGPPQLQFTDEQLRIVEEILTLLPVRLRLDCVEQGIKHRYVRRPREFWNRVDPSEAVCSDQIERALHNHFRVVAQRNYGGTLLNPLLEHIVANFRREREEDVAILGLLGYLERVLIREGCLGSDFAVFVMQREGHTGV